jgi:hypothetical protein
MLGFKYGEEPDMQERQEHRGFTITVTARDDPAGGSRISLMIARPPKIGELRLEPRDSKPEHYHSQLSGKAAIGEGMSRAKRAIDDALGPRDPFGD